MFRMPLTLFAYLRLQNPVFPANTPSGLPWLVRAVEMDHDRSCLGVCLILKQHVV